MNIKQIAYIILAGVLRYLLLTSNFSNIFTNRVEISTPLNSFKRLKEGIYLVNEGINPYFGDIFHETPTFLKVSSWVHQKPQIVPFTYIIADLLSAILMYNMAINFCKDKLKSEKLEKDEFAPGTEELQFHANDIQIIPNNILIAFLFNPFGLMNCCGLTSTVFSQLFLSLFFYFFSRKNLLLCIIFLAFETTRNLYPFVLIAPVVLVFYRKSVFNGMNIVILFFITCIVFTWVNFMIMGNWSFINGTIGFIFWYGDLQPNIGLFWYFFTEMFDHFRTMFLISYQMNATVLYLIPLTLRMRKDPILLGVILCAIMTIFKSYPCFGDVSLYISMLPLWMKCAKFTAHRYVVFCFFLITMLIMPTLWHLWIYSGSANSNFFFGATLAFCTGQIFLVTDLLYAYVKREFCIKNGQKIYIDGKEAKIILQ